MAAITAVPSFVRAGVVVIVRDDDNDDNTTGGAGPKEGGGAGGMICFERLLARRYLSSNLLLSDLACVVTILDGNGAGVRRQCSLPGFFFCCGLCFSRYSTTGSALGTVLLLFCWLCDHIGRFLARL